MAKNQADNELGLFLPKTPLSTSSTDLVPYEAEKPVTKEGKHFQRELASHERAERGYEEKAAYGVALLKELNVSTASVFVEELHDYGALKGKLQGEAYQAMGEEFLRVVAQRSAQHKLALIEVAASNIGAEVHRSLYVEPEEPSFWERLTGG